MGAFPSLAYVWEHVPPLMRAGLVAAGLDSPEVFRLAWDGSHAEALELAASCGGQGGDAEIIMELWEAVRVPSKIVVTRMATFDASDAVLAISENRKRKAAHVEHSTSASSPPVLSVTDRRWPIKLGAGSRFEGGPHARHRAERDARSKALLALAQLVRDAKLPVVTVISESDPSALLECIGHGRRARTIMKRARGWQKASQYLSLHFGVVWPTSMHMVLSWLRWLRDEVSWSSLRVGIEALAFMERAGGVPESNRLAQCANKVRARSIFVSCRCHFSSSGPAAWI